MLEKKNEGIIKCDKSTITCDIGTTQYEDSTIKCEKKNKGTTEYDKNTVTCDVGIHNVKMVPSNVRKK